MFYISVDLYRQALQTYGIFFPNFDIIFELTTIFFKILAVGINACVNRGALNFVLIFSHSSWKENFWNVRVNY